MQSSIRKSTERAAAICLFALAAIGMTGCSGGSGDSKNAEALDRYYTVDRGSFPITVLARGELDAIENHNLRFEGAGKLGLRIEQIVPDKTELKAGDPVVSFASEAYLDLIVELEAKIHDHKVLREDVLETREETYEIQSLNLEQSLDDAILNIELFLDTQAVARDESLSKLTQASNAFEVAKDALNKYRNLDYRSLSREKQTAIENQEQLYYENTELLDVANQELSQARLKDESTREKAERQVSVAENKAESALANWENARKAMRQFRRYDHPQTLRRLKIAAEKTELDFKRALVKAENDNVQGERRYRKLIRDKEAIEDRIEKLNEKYPEDIEKLQLDYEVQLERLTTRLEQTRSDYEQLILRAPVDGLVTLGNPNRRRGTAPKELVIGTSVAPKEIVARIPDLSKFLVRTEIPEIYRSRIEPGQTALLKNAALPDLDMRGQVETIDSMSTRVVSWDKGSPRVYSTTISTDSSDPDLVPGMTVEVEILVETVEDVLFVPVEAVYNREGVSYCMIKDGFSELEVEVETGRASNSLVEIVSGLDSGDEVLLHSSAQSLSAS